MKLKLKERSKEFEREDKKNAKKRKREGALRLLTISKQTDIIINLLNSKLESVMDYILNMYLTGFKSILYSQ